MDIRSADFCWPAPAKLNLFLHITGRRPDGYHLLQTIFQFIDFSDEIYIDVCQNGAIRRVNEIAGVLEHQDLVVRAAKLLQTETGTSLGADIRVEKKLPMGGGLGGGSSDAATVLVALNELWQTSLNVTRLAELGVKLGADVPIFIRGVAAWAEGVGEIITPLALAEPWFLVVVPDEHVDTGKVFSHPELTRDKHTIRIRDFLDGVTENVCQPIVEQGYPKVRDAIDWLAQYSPSRMTGTGACVFAAFDSECQANEVLAKLPPGWKAVVAKGMNTSPLRSIAEFANCN